MKHYLPAIVLPLLVGSVLCIQLWPFTLSFRQNADDNLYHFIALGGDLGSMIEYSIAEAELQGRIGKFISAPIKFATNYLLDHQLIRVLAVIIFFAMYIMSFRYLEAVCKTRIFALATLVALAFIPLVGNGHLPPNAFPLAFSLPFLVLISLRHWLLGIDWNAHNGRVKIILGKLALLPFIINNEYAMILAVIFTLLEAWCGIGAPEGKAGDNTARLPDHIARLAGNQKFFLDLLVISVAALLYIAYRLAHPSSYSGNQIDQQLSIAASLTVQWRHIAGGFSTQYYNAALLNSGAVALFWAALLSLGMGLLSWRCAFSGYVRRAGTLTVLGLAWAFCVALPVALSSKYQKLCLESGFCAYFDSRIAYPGMVIAICGLLALLYNLSRGNKVWRTSLKALLSVGIGGISGASLLSNLQVLDAMSEREQGHRLLQKYACLVPQPDPTDEYVLRAASRNIQWHPSTVEGLPNLATANLGGAGKRAYMLRYLQYRRDSGFECAATGSLEADWPLSEHSDQAGSLLLTGWHRREAWGTWSDGHEASILVSSYDSSQLPRGVTMTLSAYTAADLTEQSVGIYRNDELYCKLSVGASPQSITVPFKPFSPTGSSMLIGLALPDANSPKTIEGVADDRVLGAAIHSLSAVFDPAEKITSCATAQP